MRRLASQLCCLFLVVLSGGSHAQYPDRPVKLIVPFAPGGGVDVVARIIAQKLSENLKQPVVVENRPGAGGAIGMQSLARAAPDGYTFAITAQGLAILPSTNRDLPFDPIRGIDPVAHLTSVPIVLAVNQSLPAQNIAEFIQYARRNPGKLNAATSGPGTALPVELFRLLTDIHVTTIPYGGTAPAALSVLKGETDFLIFDTTTIKAYLKSGSMRALAVASEVRRRDMPDIPTMKESGVDYVLDIWYGAFLPGGTPKNVLRTLNAALNKAVMMPDVVERLPGGPGWRWPPR